MSVKLFEQEEILTKAGLKEEQAKAILTVFAESGQREVTKRDMDNLEYRLKVYVLQTVVAQTAIVIAAIVAMAKF